MLPVSPVFLSRGVALTQLRLVISNRLPMFLSKTYHMIEKCDSDIASWSDNGDNFVVKNVEKFATVSACLLAFFGCVSSAPACL